VDLTVDSAVVRIRAFTETGDPVEGASFQIRWTGDGDEERVSGRLDPLHGEHYFAAAGEVGVTVSAPSCADVTRILTIEGSPRLHDLRLVPHAPVAHGSIDLGVSREDGLPLARAWVTIENEAGGTIGRFTDLELEIPPDGRVRIRDVPVGSCRIGISGTKRDSPSGYVLRADAQAEVRAEEPTSIRLSLPIGGRLRVSIVDLRGRMVSPEKLSLCDREGGRIPARFLQAWTDGRWRLSTSAEAPALLASPVPPGLYIVCWARDGEGEVSRFVSICAGETADIKIRTER
jgi:hypothetical protein